MVGDTIITFSPKGVINETAGIYFYRPDFIDEEVVINSFGRNEHKAKSSVLLWFNVFGSFINSFLRSVLNSFLKFLAGSFHPKSGGNCREKMASTGRNWSLMQITASTVSPSRKAY